MHRTCPFVNNFFVLNLLEIVAYKSQLSSKLSLINLKRIFVLSAQYLVTERVNRIPVSYTHLDVYKRQNLCLNEHMALVFQEKSVYVDETVVYSVIPRWTTLLIIISNLIIDIIVLSTFCNNSVVTVCSEFSNPPS